MSDKSLQGARILLLEDEALINLAMADALQEMGCQVSSFMHLDDALQATERELPDAAVLDVNIEGIPSYQLAERLQQAGIPIVFVTGYGSPALRGKWNQFPHCHKPCVLVELKTALANALKARSGPS